MLGTLAFSKNEKTLQKNSKSNTQLRRHNSKVSIEPNQKLQAVPKRTQVESIPTLHFELARKNSSKVEISERRRVQNSDLSHLATTRLHSPNKLLTTERQLNTGYSTARTPKKTQTISNIKEVKQSSDVGNGYLQKRTSSDLQKKPSLGSGLSIQTLQNSLENVKSKSYRQMQTPREKPNNSPKRVTSPGKQKKFPDEVLSHERKRSNLFLSSSGYRSLVSTALNTKAHSRIVSPKLICDELANSSPIVKTEEFFEEEKRMEVKIIKNPQTPIRNKNGSPPFTGTSTKPMKKPTSTLKHCPSNGDITKPYWLQYPRDSFYDIKQDYSNEKSGFTLDSCRPQSKSKDRIYRADNDQNVRNSLSSFRENRPFESFDSGSSRNIPLKRTNSVLNQGENKKINFSIISHINEKHSLNVSPNTLPSSSRKDSIIQLGLNLTQKNKSPQILLSRTPSIDCNQPSSRKPSILTISPKKNTSTKIKTPEKTVLQQSFKKGRETKTQATPFRKQSSSNSNGSPINKYKYRKETTNFEVELDRKTRSFARNIIRNASRSFSSQRSSTPQGTSSKNQNSLQILFTENSQRSRSLSKLDNKEPKEMFTKVKNWISEQKQISSNPQFCNDSPDIVNILGDSPTKEDPKCIQANSDEQPKGEVSCDINIASERGQENESLGVKKDILDQREKQEEEEEIVYDPEERQGSHQTLEDERASPENSPSQISQSFYPRIPREQASENQKNNRYQDIRRSENNLSKSTDRSHSRREVEVIDMDKLLKFAEERVLSRAKQDNLSLEDAMSQYLTDFQKSLHTLPDSQIDEDENNGNDEFSTELKPSKSLQNNELKDFLEKLNTPYAQDQYLVSNSMRDMHRQSKRRSQQSDRRKERDMSPIPFSKTRSFSGQDEGVSLPQIVEESIEIIRTSQQEENYDQSIQKMKELLNKVEASELDITPKARTSRTPFSLTETPKNQQYQNEVKISIGNQLGTQLSKVGKHEEALNELEKVINIDSFNIQALYKTHEAYTKLGKRKEARQVLKQIRELMQNPIPSQEQVKVPETNFREGKTTPQRLNQIDTIFEVDESFDISTVNHS